jgi:hypothetical protein
MDCSRVVLCSRHSTPLHITARYWCIGSEKCSLGYQTAVGCSLSFSFTLVFCLLSVPCHTFSFFSEEIDHLLQASDCLSLSLTLNREHICTHAYLMVCCVSAEGADEWYDSKSVALAKVGARAVVACSEKGAGEGGGGVGGEFCS